MLSNEKIQWFLLYSKATLGAYFPPCLPLLPIPPVTLYHFPQHSEQTVGLRSLPSWSLEPFLMSLLSRYLQCLFPAYFCPGLKHAQGAPILKTFNWPCCLLKPSFISLPVFISKCLNNTGYICDLHSLTIALYTSWSPYFLHHTHFSLLIFFNAYFLYHIFCTLIK